MLTGMTGFGQGLFEDTTYRFMVQIQSVNRKFCEITVNLPRELLSLENKIARQISARVQRGYITVTVMMEALGTSGEEIQINKSLLKKYLSCVKDIADELDVEPAFDLVHLMRLPEVIIVRKKPLSFAAEKVWPKIKRALDTALKDFNNMRANEGAQILKEFTERLGKVEKLVRTAEQLAVVTVESYRDTMADNLPKIAGKGENRGVEIALEKEINAFSEKIKTAEELKRLEIHTKHFMQVMKAAGKSNGRKLDFITQEMNREINTLSAKSNDAKISKIAIEVKSELDKIREQLQNVE